MSSARYPRGLRKPPGPPGTLGRLLEPVLAFPFDEAALRQRLVEQARLEPGQCLLDLACGSGSMLIAIRKQWPGVRAVGLDDDPRLLAMARRKAASAGVSVQLVAGASAAPAFRAASFDRVLSSLFIHRLAREVRWRTLRGAHALLAPGGELHVMDWLQPTSRRRPPLPAAVEILDAHDATADAREGRMLRLLSSAGFRAHDSGRVDTLLGTIAYWTAQKPGVRRSEDERLDDSCGAE